MLCILKRKFGINVTFENDCLHFWAFFDAFINNPVHYLIAYNKKRIYTSPPRLNEREETVRSTCMENQGAGVRFFYTSPRYRNTSGASAPGMRSHCAILHLQICTYCISVSGGRFCASKKGDRHPLWSNESTGIILVLQGLDAR